MDIATLIGSAGVSLLLLAFFLNLFRFLRAEGYAYLVMNVAGGGLACYSSWLIGFMPFVVLEGTWAVVAVAGLARRVTQWNGENDEMTNDEMTNDKRGRGAGRRANSDPR
jgi:hypothetical protein